MGFYGNINNTTKVQFNFDRIFSSRSAMDEAVKNGTDGVFAGRFVLVSYDKEVHNFPIYYLKDNKLYSNLTDAMAGENEITLSIDTIVHIPLDHNLDDTSFTGYYKFIADTGALEPIANENTENIYLTNYLLDTKEYGAGRGYDGTVWQKMYAENESYFAMVAELNSIVPTLAITTDAPTVIPKAPHFDVDSSNVYYKLHIQATPGLWVKPAEGSRNWSTSTTNYPWDVTYTYPLINSSGTVTPEKDIPAAIYFNKAGFDPINIAYAADAVKGDTQSIWYDETTGEYKPEDVITIDLKGKSGQTYGVEGSIEKTEQPDTNELVIMLPSIGDTMAKVWDLVYGGKTVAEERNAPGVRETDITWEDASNEPIRRGLRLTKTPVIGHGIGYAPKEVETIAGAINTTNDLIGMIIVDASDTDKYDLEDEEWVQTANSDKIYWQNDAYYRVGIDYDPQYDENVASNNKDGRPHFEPTELNEPQANMYFDKYGDNYLLIRNINDFKKNKKYYAWSNLSTSFTVATVPDDSYQKDAYYYKVGNDYFLDTNDTPTPGRQYYKIPSSAWQPAAGGRSVIWFAANRFYRQEMDTTQTPNVPTGLMERDSSSNWIPNSSDGYELYLADRGYNADGTESDIIYKNVTNRVLRRDMGGPYYTKDEVNKAYRLITEDIYRNVWSDDSNDDGTTGLSGEHMIGDISDISLYVYTLGQTETISLYAPGTYYYVDKWVETNNSTNSLEITDNGNQIRVIGNILKDKEQTKTEGRTYFIKEVNPTVTENSFYIANEYYLQSNNAGAIEGDDDTDPATKYLLTNESWDSTHHYYERFDKHVIEDSNNIFPIYYKWNPNITVPDGVQLCWLKDKQVFEELEGYARDKNTLNGLLLETHKKFGTEDTRDVETVNGAINTLQDLTYNFATMEAGQPVLVDNYGRMHSAPMRIDTNDRWLNLVIDSNINSPSITFSHIGPDASVTHSTIDNVTPGFDETFNIADWTFDSKGHKADGGRHRVKIPGLELVADGTNTSGNVITNLEYAYDNLTAHKGTFTASRMNLGAIKLGNYTAPTTLPTGSIASNIDVNTSLSDALSTLDLRIINEENNRATALTNAINALDLGTVTNNTTDKTTTFVSSINEADGIVTYTTKGITAASTNEPGIVQLNDTINSTDTDKAATANAVRAAYDLAATKVTARPDITEGTATKITYSAQGLVTAGANLEWNDIKSFVVGKDNNQADITLDDLIAYLVSENSAALTETLTDITVTPPTKTVYVDGETLNLDGMTVTATYRRGAKTELVPLNNGYTVTPASNIPLTLTSPTVAETQTVTVTHTLTGKTATFNVTVNPKVMTGIEITQEPTTMNYTDRKTLDLDGLVVTASFNDNSTRPLNTSEYVTDPVEGATLTSGDVTVLVSVPNTEFTDSFTVHVE